MSAQEQGIRVGPAHLVGSRPAYRLICVKGRWVQDARRKLLDVRLKTSVLGGLISQLCGFTETHIAFPSFKELWKRLTLPRDRPSARYACLVKLPRPHHLL